MAIWHLKYNYGDHLCEMRKLVSEYNVLIGVALHHLWVLVASPGDVGRRDIRVLDGLWDDYGDMVCP
jgi:hypothetical protein